jgi:predicted metal-dependent enzyme (double-stranded beta helix superfamily)
MKRSCYTLDELSRLAREYPVSRDLPERFDSQHYTRTTIYRDEDVEVVVICFAEGQTTSVHDHEGSNCVVRVLRGKMLENHFVESRNGQLDLLGNHDLRAGDVSGLDGEQIHQLCNLDPNGTVLLNFYSPPFKMNVPQQSTFDRRAASSSAVSQRHGR